MEEFTKQILKNLELNGYPNKKVSFPTDKLYEIADNKGLSLNTVMDSLKDNHQVDFAITDEKIIFSSLKEQSVGGMPSMEEAQEMLKNMDPEQLKQAQEMLSNMSDEEKQAMMEQAKKMGLF